MTALISVAFSTKNISGAYSSEYKFFSKILDNPIFGAVSNRSQEGLVSLNHNSNWCSRLSVFIVLKPGLCCFHQGHVYLGALDDETYYCVHEFRIF